MIGFSDYQKWVASQAAPSSLQDLSGILVDQAHFISAKARMDIVDPASLSKSIGGALWLLAGLATNAGLMLDDVVADFVRRREMEQGVGVDRQ